MLLLDPGEGLGDSRNSLPGQQEGESQKTGRGAGGQQNELLAPLEMLYIGPGQKPASEEAV